MRVFLTGATGFIGSAIIPQLLEAGHQVLGLTRSDAGTEALIAAGVQPHRGDLEDLESIRSGAAKADGVIHCGFNHDFSKFVQNCEHDKLVIQTLGEALLGTDRPLLITSGTGMGSPGPGEPATEDIFNLSHPNPRAASEIAAEAIKEQGVNVSVVRLPQVHDPYKQGLIAFVVAITREKGASAYIGEGFNRWPAVHLIDAARVYKLALEKAEPGARYHAVAEEGITMKAIAEIVGRGLQLPVISISPEEVGAHFGWFGGFAGFDMPASSALTRQRLNWQPTGPTLLEDMEQMKFF